MRYFDSLRRAAPDVDPSALHEASALPGILLLPDQFMYAVDYDRSELFAAQGFERVLRASRREPAGRAQPGAQEETVGADHAHQQDIDRPR